MNTEKLKLIAIGLIALPSSLSAQLVEDEILIASGADWEYLYYSDVANVPADPATANPLFHSTWHTPAAYSGTPAFLSGPAMLGWGEVPNGAGNLVVTQIWGNRDGNAIPPSGERYTSYLRTTFTPTSTVTDLRFDGRIDDGAIFYVNGVEVSRINVDGDASTDPDTWTLFAASGGSETVNRVSDVTLPTPLPAGVPVSLAVSLHNVNATSSDIGFDTRVVSLIPPPPVPAPNDDFADAEALTGTLPISGAGRSDDTVGGSGATREIGEPFIAGDLGGASVWYTWTPTQTRSVSLSTEGSDFDTLLGVYTGTSVDALSLVASSDDARFYAGSRVEFEAQAGTTYNIAVDGNDGAFGAITLTIAAASIAFDPTELLVPAGSNWDYLLANNTVRAVDPDAQDPDGDFYTTWQTTADYDGPAFENGPALLGYGMIDADPVVTMVFEPANNERNAALYLRNTFTPAAEVTNLAFRGLIDDGAIIYIDGVEVARINVSPTANANSFRATARGANHDSGGVSESNEVGPQVAIVALELPADVPVELAIAVLNASATSSDLGFDMEVYSTTTPPPSTDGFVAFIATTANAGEYEVSWVSQDGALYDIDSSPDLVTWTTIATDVAGGPSGIDSILVTPAIVREFYRVVRK